MPQQTSPFIEGKWGWDFGESGWNTGADDNWLKFSYLFDNNVEGVVSSLPTAVNGEAYFLTTDNRFYFAVGTTWRSSPCPKWFIFKVRSTGMFWQFDGSVAVEINNPQQANAALEAIQDVIDTLGTAAFVSLESLATQAELDVAVANAAEYADTTMTTHVAASDPHTQYTLETDLANTSDIAKGAALVGFKQSGTGAVARTAYTKLKERVSVKDFGAIGDGVTDDTNVIQAAIDAVFSAGGGIVHVPAGSYVVSQTALTLPVVLISGDETWNNTNTSTQSCIVLRDGVTLRGEGHKKSILAADRSLQRHVISMYDMSGGGVQSLGADGGKGIQSLVSDIDSDMSNLVIDEVEIGYTVSYGLGMQYGFMTNNRISRLHVHDTLQDAIDWKARPRYSDGESPYGNSMSKILMERYGNGALTGSNGIDVRGQIEIDTIVCRDFHKDGNSNAGVNFASKSYESIDQRAGSNFSSLVNFYIDSGNPSGEGTRGIVVSEAENISIANGTIRDCKGGGLSTQQQSSHGGTGDGLKVVNVDSIGCWNFAFKTDEPWTSFIGCKAKQSEDFFSEKLGNLSSGQTSLVVERSFDPSTVKVYKNDALLTLTADYTVSGTSTINLTVGASLSDIFLVATPITDGFVFSTGSERSAVYGTLVGCTTKGVIDPTDINSVCNPSLVSAGNNFDTFSTLRISPELNYLDAVGPGANIDANIAGKGTGAFIARSRGSRAFVATNHQDSAINYIEARGAASGSAVRLSAQGSDSNISLELWPKGTGAVLLNALEAADDAAAAAAGVPINGIYRTGNDLKIRLV